MIELMMLQDESSLLQELEQLEKEHAELNEVMDDPYVHLKFDQLTIARFKKRKLLIKDRITLLKGVLCPDIIA